MTDTHSPTLDARIPDRRDPAAMGRAQVRRELVNPANKRKYEIIVIGTGLAGASAAASFGELGYNVKAFTYNDSAAGPLDRRPGRHQRCEELPNDGDSIYRLFYDTVKGGDFRSASRTSTGSPRCSNEIIDQAPPKACPSPASTAAARQPVLRRRPGVANVLRTGPDRPAAAARCIPGTLTQVNEGPVEVFTDPRCSKSWSRTTEPSASCPRSRDRRDHLTLGPRRGAGHGRLLERVLPVDQRHELQRNRGMAGTSQGCALRQPVLHPDPPNVHPASDEHQSKLTLMSESLRNDGRIWVPAAPTTPSPERHPRGRARLLPRAPVSGLRQPGPRDVASRAAMRMIDQNRGVGPLKNGVYLDFSEAIKRLGGTRSRNGTATSSRCTNASPTRIPTRSRCGSIPRPTTRWAACGSTTT